jgi:hypothetical protein
MYTCQLPTKRYSKNVLTVWRKAFLNNKGRGEMRLNIALRNVILTVNRRCLLFDICHL